MKLYVGNLSFNTTENSLQEAFEQYGEVRETVLIQDKATGRSRGFGFVTMATKEAAEAAINALNGNDFEGRNLMINEARPREDRPQQGGRSFSGSRR